MFEGFIIVLAITAFVGVYTFIEVYVFPYFDRDCKHCGNRSKGHLYCETCLKPETRPDL